MSSLWRDTLRSIVLLSFLLGSCPAHAQLGKDGARTVAAAGTIVNEYTELTSDALAGTSLLNVTSSSLNANGRFSAPLAPGDLVFIIQVQGASMSSADDSTYGTLLSIGNCGRHELAEVSAVPSATTIQLSCALQYSYTSNGRVQVVRVPRYSSLTINSGGVLTCAAWNGNIGGVLALEVLGNTLINSGGRIDVSGLGFRGGQLLENNSWFGVGNHRWPTDDYGAEKGEGVIGYQAGYDMFGGRYCRGAAINGGGGGNGHNAGGGGGGNAGNPSAWTGGGNPDLSNPAWSAAWNQEYLGFAGSTSSGGGRGGYSFSSADENALALGPFNSSWGGDQRRNNGGIGGRPLDYSTGRIFLGGGGGAGDQNDQRGGPGGNGGGLVYLFSFGDLSGSGEIRAQGANGFSTLTNNGTDGAGGGGAGGTVVLKAGGTVSGVNISANGGNGGNQSVTFFNDEAEGPGGGGGGGYIGISAGSPTRSATGGANGTTNSRSLTEFPPNGATRGGAGLPNESVPAYKFIYNPLLVCAGSTATINIVTSGTLPSGVSYQWFTQPVGGVPTGAGGTSFTTPPLYATDTFYAAVCPGHFRYPFIVQVDAMTASFVPPSGCSGQTLNFSGTGTSSIGPITGYSWNFGDGSPTNNSQNASHAFTSSGNYTVTLTVTSSTGCTQTATQTVSVAAVPVISVTPSVTSGCGPLSVSFTNNTTSASGFVWNFGDGSPSSTATSPTHIYSSNGSYTVTMTATNASGCSATYTGSNLITVANGPTASFSTTPSICLGDTFRFSNLSTANGTPITGYSWSFGDGTPVVSQVSPIHSYGSPGNYPVTLTTTAGVCSDDTTINVVVSPAPVVAFTSSFTTGCAPFVVNFSNATTGSPSYNWSFGDGGTSPNATPSHTYTAAGSYTVTLIATQGTCVDTGQLTIQVNPSPVAVFRASSVCQGDSVRFINSSTFPGSALSRVTWNFGDGGTGSQLAPAHFYTAPGSYSVLLEVTNVAGCSDTAGAQVVVNAPPTVAFTANNFVGCDRLDVSFLNTTSGAASYSWLFGDGGNSALQNPSHTYNAPGNYTVVLTATSDSGCAASRALINLVSVRSTPQASINASASSICSDACISFAGQASAPVTNWTWTFDGGQPGAAAVQSPSQVCYPIAGNYDVTLIVTDGFCSDTVLQNSFVNVADCSSLPIADFRCSDTSICVNDCIDFVSLSLNSTAWSWSFPGAVVNSAAIERPSGVCYQNLGVFPVRLIATNPAGQDTLEVLNFITVNPLPAVPVISQTGNLLTAPSASNYQWYFNGIAISGATGQTYTATLSGAYSVEVIDGAGCSAMSQEKQVILVSIDEQIISGGVFNVYPNPLHETVNVVVRVDSKLDMRLRITDMLGQNLIVDKGTMLPGESVFRYSCANWSSGIYWIIVETETSVSAKMVVRP